MVTRRIRQYLELVATLREALEEREEDRGQVEIGQDRHVDRRAAGQNTQHEATRDRQHVDDHHVLDREGIGDLKDEIRRDHPADHRHAVGVRAECKATHQTDQHQQPSHRPGNTRLELAGCQRSVALLGMLAVAFDVHQVVDQVHRARDHAEEQEHGQRRQRLLRIAQPAGQDDGGEDEAVLGPLPGAEGSDQGADGGALPAGRWVHSWGF